MNAPRVDDVALPLDALLTPDELEARLRAIGDARYHSQHPFHHLMRDGKLTKGQVQAWALNRYYYQSRIPMKDSAFMSRAADRELRREWIHRIHDHDGEGGQGGGIERWLKLAEGLDLDREYVMSEDGILPATKFAVEAYVRYVRDETMLKAVASSLTELFSPTIIAERVAGMLKNYDFVSKDTLAYFDARLTQAPRDSSFALDFCKEHATTIEKQQDVIDALLFKTDVLWAQLDALYFAYVAPGLVPPGAFVPEDHAAHG